MERIGVRMLAALAPAAMLVVDPAGWFPFGPVKWLVVSTLILGGSALVLRHRPLQVSEVLAGSLAVLLGWLSLAAVVGEEGIYAWVGTPERRFGVLTWALCALVLLVGRSLDVRRDGPTLVTGLLVAGVGVGAVATMEALGFEPKVLDVGSRLTGTFGSSAYLGAATALLLPVAVGVALGAGPLARRQLAAGAAVLLGVACLGSGARSAWVGLAVAAVVAGLGSARIVWDRVRADTTRSTQVAALVVVAAAAVIFLTPVGSRISATTDPDAAGGRGRLDEWRVAGHVLEGHLVFGVGPEGYRAAFGSGVDPQYEIRHGRELQPDRAHSAPLDIALAGGVPALLAWGLLVILTARAAWSIFRSGPGWLRGIAGGLVAHGVGQLLFFPVVELEPIAWLLAGVLIAARPGRHLSRAKRRPSAARPLRLSVAVALGVGAALAAGSGITEVLADHKAEEAAEALARGDERAAADAADAAVDLRPDIVRLHLLAAQADVADGQGLRTGLERVDDALEISPKDPIAINDRTRLLVERAEATQTESHIVAAARDVERRVAIDPYNAEAWRLLARVADVVDDDVTADQARQNADLLTGDR